MEFLNIIGRKQEGKRWEEERGDRQREFDGTIRRLTYLVFFIH